MSFFRWNPYQYSAGSQHLHKIQLCRFHSWNPQCQTDKQGIFRCGDHNFLDAIHQRSCYNCTGSSCLLADPGCQNSYRHIHHTCALGENKNFLVKLMLRKNKRKNNKFPVKPAYPSWHSQTTSWLWGFNEHSLANEWPDSWVSGQGQARHGMSLPKRGSP